MRTWRRLWGSVVLASIVVVAWVALVSTVGVASAAAPVSFAATGFGAGQIDDAEGVAVAQATGNVYIADLNNNRIDEFDGSGRFIEAFGYGVADGATEALQVCTTTCYRGISGVAPGEMAHPKKIAIDQATGNIDISEQRSNRIQEFSPSGRFQLMFGGGVDQGPHHPGNLCTASFIAEGDSCGAGASGTGPGEFSNEVPNVGLPLGHPLAIDGNGNVWVGDIGRLEEFSSEGLFTTELKIPGRGELASLAVDTDVFSPSYEDIYVLKPRIAGSTEVVYAKGTISKYSPSGELLGVLDSCEICYPTELSLDPTTGNVFISNQYEALSGSSEAGIATLLEYGSSGIELASFAAGTVNGIVRGLAFSGETDSLYVVGKQADGGDFAQGFLLPEPGPSLEGGGEHAVHIGKTAATLNANVNPEGVATTYHFQYVDQRDFEAAGFSSPATQTTPESASIGDDFAEHPAEVAANGLNPDTTYHFRVVAENANAPGGIAGEDATFTTLPILRVDASACREVTSSSVTLIAQIDPLGEPASYHFEYLPEAVYDGNLNNGLAPFAGATSIPASEASIPARAEDRSVAQQITSLVVGTTYRYRVVAVESLGSIDGPQHAFTTQGSGGALALPDGRTWEMISPVEKNGGGVSTIDEGPFTPIVQAAANGQTITYGSQVAFGQASGAPPGNQYLSRRDANGWSVENIDIPLNAGNRLGLGDPPYKSFSEDLARGLVSNDDYLGQVPPPLPGTEAVAGLGNFYLRDDADNTFQALLSEANLQEAGVHPQLPLAFEVATPDLAHVIVREKTGKDELYEWNEGRFEPIDLLPGKSQAIALPGAAAGAGGTPVNLEDSRVISRDGRRVVWSTVSPRDLYLRENVGEPQSRFNAHGECLEPKAACTIQVDAAQGGPAASGEGHFLAASADDTQIYFADRRRLTADATATAVVEQLGDLYRFEPDAAPGSRLADITVDHVDPNGAEVLGIVGVSDDGSYVYFVANGVLGNGAVAGAERGDCEAQPNVTILASGSCNLYLLHEGTLSFVARLTQADNEDASETFSLGGAEPYGTGDWRGEGYRDARLSSDGKHLLFVSRRALTSYDNVAANGSHCGKNFSGEALPVACGEVYLYEPPSAAGSPGRLACVSCDPTGARPLGYAGIPPGTRTSNSENGGEHMSRALSGDGSRVFFDSYDALVPQDTNGRMDVYEWEQLGTGTCTAASAGFSSASDGCVSLLSSGTSSENSEFVDASADGSDVFFLTGASLVTKDPGSVDLYDAREGGGLPEAPTPPAACEGDACQAPVKPSAFDTPSSAVFSGSGNAVPASPSIKRTRSKRSARAQALTRALKRCRALARRSSRASCERRARSRYGRMVHAKTATTASRRHSR